MAHSSGGSSSSGGCHSGSGYSGGGGSRRYQCIKGSYGYRICNAEDQGKELRKADRYVEVHAKPVRYSAKLTIAMMHGKSA